MLKNNQRNEALKLLYEEAYSALTTRYGVALRKPDGVLSEEEGKCLDRQLSPKKPLKDVTINELFRRLCQSAINRAGWPGYLISDDKEKGKLSWELIELEALLSGFDPVSVHDEYGPQQWEKLHAELVTVCPGLRESKPFRSFARTVTEAAAYLSRFKTATEFCSHADEALRKDIHGLPTDVAKNVYGIGYALACDFLKECGVDQLGKPDVWLVKVMATLRLLPLGYEKDHLRATQNMIIEIASTAGVAPFAVDKVFWLLGAENAAIGETKLAGAKPDLDSFLDDFNKKHRDNFLIDWNGSPAPVIRALYSDISDDQNTFAQGLGNNPIHEIVDSRLRQAFAPSMVTAILEWVRTDSIRRGGDTKAEISETIRLMNEAMESFTLLQQT